MWSYLQPARDATSPDTASRGAETDELCIVGELLETSTPGSRSIDLSFPSQYARKECRKLMSSKRKSDCLIFASEKLLTDNILPPFVRSQATRAGCQSVYLHTTQSSELKTLLFTIQYLGLEEVE